MKKVMIAKDVRAVLGRETSFLDRTDILVFVPTTNDEALKIHRSERVDLIMTHLNMPGMPSEQFCSLVREDAALRGVSILMTCVNTPEAIRMSSRCRVNAVLLEPLHPVLLIAKAQQLLYIAARDTLRVLMTANVDGQCGDGSFYCRSRDISASGMLIETGKRLPEGSRLTCQFYLPNAKKVQATGKIVRIIEQTSGDENYQYGLMFTDIERETRQLLLTYVEELQKQ